MMPLLSCHLVAKELQSYSSENRGVPLEFFTAFQRLSEHFWIPQKPLCEDSLESVNRNLPQLSLHLMRGISVRVGQVDPGSVDGGRKLPELTTLA
ncbi:hypothetical protein JZ751_004946, partial [Albula glossodonta]